MKTKNIFLVIVLLACPIFAQAQFHIEKKVLYDPATPNQYTANLEAYMVKKQTLPTPVDIVMLVDVSKYQGSDMLTNTKTGFKLAITQLIKDLQKKFENQNRSDIKLAIVTYSQNADVMGSGLKSIDDYELSGNDFPEVANIPSPSGGYHYPDIGLKKAKDLFEKEDKDGNHQKIVLLCIFNLPNQTSSLANSNNSTPHNISNILTPFSSGLKEAYELKNTVDATVYSIILTKASTGTQFIYSNYSDASKNKKMGVINFERFSSKYKNTYRCNIESSTNYSATYTPTFYDIDGNVDTSPTENKYVYYGNTADLQKNNWPSLINEIEAVSNTPKPSGFIVKDILGDLKVSDDSKIQLSHAKCNRVDNGTYYFDDPGPIESCSPSTSYNVNTNTLAVSKYNFTEVTGESTPDSGSGYKLIVQYPMIIKSGVTMPGTLYTGTSESGIFYGNTKMQALTPASVNVYKIQVTIRGLHNGESATFNVYKLDGSNKTLKTRLIATQKDDTGSASTSYIVPEAGNYEVEETSWNWPYTLTNPTSGRSITKSVSGTSVVNFEFRNGSSATSPNHTESSTVITTLD